MCPHGQYATKIAPSIHTECKQPLGVIGVSRHIHATLFESFNAQMEATDYIIKGAADEMDSAFRDRSSVGGGRHFVEHVAGLARQAGRQKVVSGRNIVRGRGTVHAIAAAVGFCENIVRRKRFIERANVRSLGIIRMHGN